MADQTRTPAGETRKDGDSAPAVGEAGKAEHAKRHKDELLDEGVEETFPASDPVAVKHIT